MSSRQSLRLAAVLLAACGVLHTQPALGWFERYQPVVQVIAPYLDMHTGPGRGYPIFHVAEAGEQIMLLKRRTGWVKIRATGGQEGWIPENQLRHTADPDGQALVFKGGGRDQFPERRWEFGLTSGEFDGAAAIGVHAGFAMTRNILLQLEASQVLGDYSDSQMFTGSVLMFPFPEWRVSPFFGIGTGIINVSPQTTIVSSDDRSDEIVHAATGANVFLSDRFMLRVEYRWHTVLTTRNENEEIEQWKAGFSIFF